MPDPVGAPPAGYAYLVDRQGRYLEDRAGNHLIVPSDVSIITGTVAASVTGPTALALGGAFGVTGSVTASVTGPTAFAYNLDAYIPTSGGFTPTSSTPVSPITGPARFRHAAKGNAATQRYRK